VRVTLLHAAAISRVYGDGPSRRTVLGDVDLSVDAGEFVAVVGPSGSGKTTLLQLLGALDTPTTGTVSIDGRTVSSMSDQERTEVRRHRVGFVFQQYNLVPVLRAWENVALPLVIGRRPVAERQQRARALLDQVGLADRAEAFPAELSGGELQRVALARALVHEPALVLADEPTGSLDSSTGLEVMGLFQRLRDETGCAVVVVTHDMRMASIADRIVRLRDGRIVDTILPGDPAEPLTV
jgi:putative ABC transport system ATP-binding protein